VRGLAGTCRVRDSQLTFRCRRRSGYVGDAEEDVAIELVELGSEAVACVAATHLRRDRRDRTRVTSRPDPSDQRCAADYVGTPDGARIAQLLDQLATEALRYITPLDARRPGDESLPPDLRLANGA